MSTVKQTISVVQGNIGLSRTTVIIGLLAFMFVIFIAARGTLPQYVGLLFKAQPKIGSQTASAQQNSSIIDSLNKSNTQSSTQYSNGVPSYNETPFNF